MRMDRVTIPGVNKSQQSRIGVLARSSPMSKSIRTCRHCLGTGCVHCGERGQVRRRVFTDRERQNWLLRKQIFGEAGAGQYPQRRD